MARNDGPSDPLARMAKTMRRWIVEQSHEACVGHIGSALSIVDILAALFGEVMHEAGTTRPGRDRFVLGKGHAALALYAALRYLRVIDEAAFRTYCQDGSLYGVHPEHGAKGIDASTGSLGQGLSIACGLALGMRRRCDAKVYAVLSDAECNEGQVWEAVMFAAHHRLGNLFTIIDVNGLQALGRTKDVLNMEPLVDKWRAFGWRAEVVDGHAPSRIADRLLAVDIECRPTVLLARTRLGNGVPFMHDSVEWHYRNLNDELAKTALDAIEVSP